MTKQKIWIDTDLSVGMKRHTREGYCDVDDGYAVLQLMKSPEVDIIGISAVFGNTLIENAYGLCQKMAGSFASNNIPVYKGAKKAIDLASVESNEAVDALYDALNKQKMTIMAIGPATNIGLLLLTYPDVKSQIEKVVLVAGRRKPTDYFNIGNQGNRARDLNFDLDNNAFRILFENEVPVVLCPFEISSKVWITYKDLDQLDDGSPANAWLTEASGPWLRQWQELGAPGFNPFDVLASHFIIFPGDIIFDSLNARLEIHPDDTLGNDNSTGYKQYLICDKGPGYPVTYCYDVVKGYHDKLIRTFLD
ncbi:nucleoside hydrolase [Membranihabitans maritimus]|uniref:nucleoside hydrolase n=1 Tax=Membranihabitans maritimus TaxID=2904244 RepID=UPI001F3A0635|nr:nucleoside hydrolase [Membranihabitans maritimus]